MSVASCIRRGRTAVRITLLILSTVLLSRASLFACACGCNVFTVGPRWMMATTTGMTLSLQYNYMNQNYNWSGTGKVSADLNDDKQILTHFYTLGFQTMFSRGPT